MDTKKALDEMLQSDGRSRIQISNAMGRNPNFLSATISRGSAPRADTLALIGQTCGWDLLLRKRDSGEEIVIDPSES